MIWRVEWDERARKDLRKLDKGVQKAILQFMRERISTEYDPRRFGKSLSYDKYGLWRYRVRDHRIICLIEEEEVTVLVVKVGHRKNIYH